MTAVNILPSVHWRCWQQMRGRKPVKTAPMHRKNLFKQKLKSVVMT